MDKVKAILMILFFMVLLVACSNRQVQNKTSKEQHVSSKQAFLSEAKIHLAMFVKENMRNPKTTELSDVSVVLNSDSLCVLNFRFLTENAYGGHVNGKAQFIWLKHEGNYYQSWQSDKDEKPHCIGDDDWLGELSNILAFTLPFEYCDTDSFVKAKCVKGDTVNTTDKYIQAYCIVKKYGKRVLK